MTLFVPFRLEAQTKRIVQRLRRYLSESGSAVLFAEESGALLLTWARVWGGAAAGLFTILCCLDGTVFQNQPSSAASTGFYAVLAIGVSLLLVLTCASNAAFLPRLRGQVALKLAGIQALWRLDARGAPASLRATLGACAYKSGRVGIIAVTGNEVLGMGPGPAGGLLNDVLAAAPGMPVYLLLLQPDSPAPDPEGRRMNVFQTALAENGISPATFQRKLRATLEAVADLNEPRQPENQIHVHYYNEKPPFQGIFFDEAAFIAPSSGHESGAFYAEFVSSGKGGGASFFEIFRRQFNRIWVCAVPTGSFRKAAPSNGAEEPTVLERAAQLYESL
jgi:hypothetical protein